MSEAVVVKNEKIILQGTVLRQLARSNETSRIVFEHFSHRERLSTFTDISKLRYKLVRRENERLVEIDYIKLWNDLEAAGLGSVRKGRRGNPDKFLWFYSLKDVALAAKNGQNQETIEFLKNRSLALVPQIPLTKPNPRRSDSVKAKLKQGLVTTLYFPFEDQMASIQVPGKLSQDRIDELQKMFQIPLRKKKVR